MAIAFDSSSRSGTTWSTSATSKTWSHTVGSGSNRCLVVTVMSYDSGTGDKITGITYAGVAMTKITGIQGAVEGTNQYTSVWVLMAPASGANNIVVSFSETIDYFFCCGNSYDGVSQAGVDAYGSNSGNSGTLSVPVTTVADNCWLSGCGWNRSRDLTAGANTIIRQSSDSFHSSLDSNGAKTPAGSYSLAATASSGNWWMVAVSLAPSSPPNPTTPFIPQFWQT